MNIVRFGFLSAVMLLSASPALAQREVPQDMRENVELAGTIKQLAPGVLQIATAEGEPWLVRMEGRPRELRLSFVGKADPGFLKSGMLVQFEGTVNKRGQLQEKLEQLTVTSLREGIEVGIFQEGGLRNTAGLFSNEEPAEKPKKQPRPDAVRCRVTGYITKISRSGELTVNCRSAVVTAELADAPQVSVDLTDLRLAQAGDKVEVRGWHVKNQKGTVWSREVSVTAANVLGEAKKKPRDGEKSADKRDGEGNPAEESTKKESAEEKKAD